MTRNDIDYGQVGQGNMLPSTLGNGMQMNNLGFRKVSEDGNMAARNGGSTTLEPYGLRAWTTESQPNPSMAATSKSINESHYSLPYTLHSDKVPAWSIHGIQMPAHYFMGPEFGTPNGLLEITAIDDRFDDQNLVEGLSTFSGLDHDLVLFPSELSHGQKATVGSGKRFNLLPDHQSLTLDTNIVTRPLSDSYFSRSNNTGSFDFVDLSAFSEVPSFASATSSDYTPRSSFNLSSTPLSPVPSPRHSQTDLVRGGNRVGTSQSPRASVQASPHSFDGVRKRWSTGSYGPRPNRATSPFLTQTHSSRSRLPSPLMRQKRSIPSTNSTRQHAGRIPVHFLHNNVLLPSNFEANVRFRNADPLASQGLFRTLQSDTESHHHYFDHYSEFPGPPDLLGPLKEERELPPPEDMMPSDPSMTPHEQELRFENDLYTPKWVRGHGNKREGWCGICKPGRWLVLKNSAFWYDKSFSHGISAPTGKAFATPKEMRRTDGNTNIWEGLCGNCDEWIALVSSKKKAQPFPRKNVITNRVDHQCHNHPKNETLKRRRENTPRSCNPPTATSRTTMRKLESPTSAGPSATPPLPGGGIIPEPKSLSPLHTVATAI
ncbi:conserved hypothetical protein [Histoplasma capsulatum G186AR]|uniref:Transcription regulator Rua1 C-terminal domain-containing protein n=1 Tax=Ajellomyces capsulatus (strain G186AR / H82 / ATCC MYA-2454 / RMSCC 2432) TaxID=447093 RepID=C0NU87_AJECG|nr:uncharacterized protein HCBG_06918 [Histoplasma capsulatum G186AR]EEH04967.1 conserved hypothetical protein [Histoplasma capsulatum G186AR]